MPSSPSEGKVFDSVPRDTAPPERLFTEAFRRSVHTAGADGTAGERTVHRA